MVYGPDAAIILLLFVLYGIVWIAGVIITVISFIVHRKAHPKAAAILAGIGFICKLPVYLLLILNLPNTIFYQNFLMCFMLAAVIIAAAGYTIYMIKFAIRDNKKQKSEEQ